MVDIRSSLGKFLALPPDQRIIGPYRLIGQLGSGSFAPVWLADEVYEGEAVRKVAIKLFAPTDPGTLQTIILEAQQLCSIDHPNVVRFHGIRYSEDQSVLGLVMEYFDGTPLTEVFAKRKQLSIKEALAVGASVASALAAVHRAGIVHRDIRPANVLAKGNTYKLIDFGIALSSRSRSVGRSTPWSLEDSGFTPLFHARAAQGYLDPACVSDPARENTPSSDLYALGALIFACATGRSPAAGHEGLDWDILRGRLHAPKLRTLAPRAPEELERIVAELLEPDPESRPRSAELVMLAIERARIHHAGGTVEPPPEEEGPFRGLARFERPHRHVFFGRRADVVATMDRMRTCGLVALIGPSGSGKSSLARAGVLPAIAEGALGEWSEAWDTLITVPGNDPRRAIETMLIHVLGQERLSAAEAVERLVEWAEAEGERKRRGLVLLVDQLEELVTLASGTKEDAESRRWTVELLVRLGVWPLPGVRVLVAARRDLLDPLLALDQLGPIIARGMLLVEPLRDDAWVNVLDAALATYGYTFEDNELRMELLAQLRGTAGAMPLFQFALKQLWAQRDRAGKRITRSSVRTIGGIAGALERHAEETFASATAHGIPETTLRHVLVALTTPDGTRATKEEAALIGLGAERDRSMRAAIKYLEDARLLVREATGAITLAHDALLVQWSKLRAWVLDVREDRQLADELERTAGTWARGDGRHSAQLLWTGWRLGAAQEILKREQVHLSVQAVRFIRVSRRHARRGLMIQIGLGVVVLAVIAILGIQVILRSVKEAEQARDAERVKTEQKEKADKAKEEAEQAQKQAERRQQEAALAKSKAEEEQRKAEKVKKELQGLLEQAKTTRNLDQTLKEYDKLVGGDTPAITTATPATPADNPTTSDKDAIQALRTEVTTLAQQRCRGELKGTINVRVKFAMSGAITTALLATPRFVNTEQGSCVLDLFKRRSIGPLKSDTSLTTTMSILLK